MSWNWSRGGSWTKQSQNGPTVPATRLGNVSSCVTNKGNEMIAQEEEHLECLESAKTAP